MASIGRRLLGALLVCALAQGAAAQSLLDTYRTARFRAAAERYFEQHGRHAHALPPEPLPVADDTLAAWLAARMPAAAEPEPVVEVPAFVAQRVRPIRRLEMGYFARTFADVKWSFLGRLGFTPVDTSRTSVLRAKLQQAWGDPTITAVERDDERNLHPDEPVQFAYWVVVNDSIPVIVMDDDGPFGRGLVFASEQRYRGMLADMRRAVLEPLATATAPAPYVDLFYRAIDERWYRVGFDGQRHFAEPTRRPRQLRRRPRLD